jgi:hypothetical protein
MGGKYVTREDPSRNLLYISALDETHFKETQVLLANFTDAIHRTLFQTRLQWDLTIILPTAEDFKAVAPEGIVGYYVPAEHTVIAIDRGRVLLHEFTHAVHHADCDAARQTHPLWIVEGLATLFEASEITPAGLEPQVDARLFSLQKALRAKKLVPLAQLLKMSPEDFMRQPELTYAESRYLMLYVFQQEQLAPWYRAYKRGFTSDASGAKALEAALGKELPEIEADWIAWAGKLRLPASEVRAAEARLGIQFRDDDRKVRITGLTAGGAADRTNRLREGDVVAAFNNNTINNSGELAAAIRSAGPMRTVTIQVVRDGHPVEIQQPLDSPK